MAKDEGSRKTEAPKKEAKGEGSRKTEAPKKETKAVSTRRASGSDKPNFFQRSYLAIRRYVIETIGELRKVQWPTREEALYLTRIVIIVIIIMSLTLGLLDFLFSRGIGLLLQ
jgi:preprotein translocase subunit SecE